MSEVIYLVSSGDYSDCSVTAAFTSREAAEAAIATHPVRYESFFVEEKPLNPAAVADSRPFWLVGMVYETGDRATAERRGLDDVIDPIEDRVLDHAWSEVRLFQTMCFADDAEHAIKIANERRTQHKAMKGVEHE